MVNDFYSVLQFFIAGVSQYYPNFIFLSIQIYRYLMFLPNNSASWTHLGEIPLI